MNQSEDSFNYEDAIKRLEGIVSKLEKAEVSLDESFELYKEGNTLLVLCQDKLNRVEKKIKALKPDVNGEITLVDFDKA